jgi:hypothetical protein
MSTLSGSLNVKREVRSEVELRGSPIVESEVEPEDAWVFHCGQ